MCVISRSMCDVRTGRDLRCTASVDKTVDDGRLLTCASRVTVSLVGELQPPPRSPHCSRVARGPQRGPGRRSGVRTAVPCRTAAPAGEPPRPSSSATPRSTPAAPSSRFVTGSTVETTHPQPINEAEQHAARGQSPQKAHTHTQRRRSCAAADRRRTLTPPARRCRRRRGVPHGWLSCPPPWWQPTTRALCLASGRRHRGR